MANHKWDHSDKRVRDANQKCLNCSIERYMLGGDFQCWEYFDPQSSFGLSRATVCRPRCKPDRGATQGFYRDGTYIILDDEKEKLINQD